MQEEGKGKTRSEGTGKGKGRKGRLKDAIKGKPGGQKVKFCDGHRPIERDWGLKVWPRKGENIEGFLEG